MNNPITLAVIEGMLSATAREMSLTMAKTCRSPILKLARDFSNAIFDHRPQMIMQGEDIPNHLGALMFSCKEVAKYFADEVYPGDIIYHNDPATGNSHLQDMCMYKPVFLEGRLMFWVANKAHMLDTGGPVAGGYNPAAEDLYSEGLRITPVKLYERGRERRDVIDMIVNNVRTQRELRGDMQAQLGVLGVAERRLGELVGKYGVDTVQSCLEELLARAEHRIREAIRQMPDGEYKGLGLVEDDGRNGPSEIHCTISIAADRMRVRLDSRKQVNSYINSYAPNSTSMVYAGILAYLDPTLPHNEGLYRPIEVDVGEAGSMTNAQFPAPCACTTSTIGINITDAVLDTLSKALPEKAVAPWAHVNTLTFSGMRSEVDHSDYFIYFSFNSLMGGAGAVSGMDGWSGVGSIAAAGALKYDDIEVIEAEFPILVEEYQLRCDSGNVGRWRGGLGVSFKVRALVPMDVTRWGEGEFTPETTLLPPNRFVDRDLRKAEYFVVDARGVRTEIEKHSIGIKLSPGDLVGCEVIGGGGVGDPFDRDLAQLAEDVRNGIVSKQSASREYAVVFAEHSDRIDVAGTSDQRERGRG